MVNNNTVHLIRIPPDLYRELKTEAQAAHLSVTKFIELRMREVVNSLRQMRPKSK